MIERGMGSLFLEFLFGVGEVIAIVGNSIVVLFLAVDGAPPSYFANFRL